jgi:hypothetical protein
MNLSRMCGVCWVLAGVFMPWALGAHQTSDDAAGGRRVPRHSLLRPTDGVAGTSGVVEQKPGGGTIATNTVPRKKSTQRGGRRLHRPMSDELRVPTA